MRMIIVAGLLMMALLGAVVGSVRMMDHPAWVSAPDEFNGAPEREISDRVTPGARLFGNRG
jgi:hypothetical protein